MPKLLDENSLLAIKTYIDAIALTLAPAFSENTMYNAGDVVSHQNKLYKCKDDNTEGTWVASEWDEVDVLTLINASKSIKTLNTNNYAAQSVSSSESLIGTGSINLHEISKTGNYSSLRDRPIKSLLTFLKTINKAVQSIAPTDIANSYTFGQINNGIIPTALVYSGQQANQTEIQVTVPVYGSIAYDHSADEAEVDISELWVLDTSTGKMAKIGTQDGYSALKTYMSDGGLYLVNTQCLVVLTY